MPQILAFILSIATESLVAFALIRGLRWGSGTRAALAAALGTAVTHPLAWPAVLCLEAAIGYPGAVALVEAAAVLAESLAYRLIVQCPWRRALLASLAANAASSGAGVLYYAVSG